MFDRKNFIVLNINVAHNLLRKLATPLMFLLILFYNQAALAEQTPHPLRIAVASNFAPVLAKLLPKFTTQTGIKTQVISGATGALFQQIRHGAPFDVFLAADAIRPQQLAQQNLIVKNSIKSYAIGQLALYSATNLIENSVKTKTLSTKMAIITLKKNSPQRLAIANPNTAPYGLAAKQCLQHLGLWQYYKNKLIVGININQTFQQIRSQAVNLGIVAYSQLKLNKLSGVLLPEDSYATIKQQFVILKSSQNIIQAKAFSQFLLSENSQTKIYKLGYKKVAIESKNHTIGKATKADNSLLSRQ